MFSMIKSIIGTYLVVGAEEDWEYHNNLFCTKKPNIIYRIYKRFNRDFRLEMNTFVLSGLPTNKLNRWSMRWSKRH